MIDTNPPQEEWLSHYGKKGMKWGVRNEDEPVGETSKSSKPPAPVTKESHKKQIAIGIGALAVAAGAGYAAYSLNKSGALPLSSLKSSAANKVGEKAVEKLLLQPKTTIHLARAKHKGLTFIQQGGTPDYFAIFDKAGMNTAPEHELFQKIADGTGNIAARFLDPEGRRDHAGRNISHDVVIPRTMASGVENLDDVKTKIWPHLKDAYDTFWQENLTPKYMR